jgi:hypothetical protein
VKLRRRGERVLSPWVLVIAAVWSLVPVASLSAVAQRPDAARAHSAATTDPGGYLRIGEPFELVEATPDVVAAIDKAYGTTVVRLAEDTYGTTVGFLIVVPVADCTIEDADQGVREAGGTSRFVDVAGTPAVLVDSGDKALFWCEDGALLGTLASSLPAADALGRAVIAAPVPRSSSAP